ncbi:hypothetical protein FBR01_02085 [Anaerolineae bacterium CFX8]|nr:hypothetical protein [Anaerolineae bacterium CFX8]
MSIAELRRQYHQRLCRDVLRTNRDYLVNIADKASRASRDIVSDAPAITAAVTEAAGAAPGTSRPL